MSSAAAPRKRGAVGAQIGPNAIIRMRVAIEERCGRDITNQVFARAGLSQHLAADPVTMVDEADVARLHAAAASVLDGTIAVEIAARAGRLTGDYVLNHRIPRLAQIILRALPRALAARALLTAIRHHAWTFCGSARLHITGVQPVAVTLDGGLLSVAPSVRTTMTAYYAATFERLFDVLVCSSAVARVEPQWGDRARFTLSW